MIHRFDAEKQMAIPADLNSYIPACGTGPGPTANVVTEQSHMGVRTGYAARGFDCIEDCG